MRPAGTERAFLALVDRHHASLTRVARLWLDDPRLIEALIEQTWVSMLRRLEPFDQHSSLKGWLCVTLIRLARVHMDPDEEEVRRPSVDPERFRSHGEHWEGHWREPPSPWAPGNLPAGVLEAAVQVLPRCQRSVLVLRDIEQLTSHEVQSALGLHDEEQRILLHQARSRLRAALERHQVAHANAP